MALSTKFTVNQVQIHQGTGYAFVNAYRPGPGIPVTVDGNIYPTITDPDYGAWVANDGTWVATTPYLVGNAILDPNGNVEVCTTAGTSGATVPTFATVVGTTTTDGTVTWTMKGRGGTGPTWVASFGYQIDDQLRDSNKNIQICIVAGTSAATVPTWNTAQYGATDDGTAVWFNLGPTLSLAYSDGEMTIDMEGTVEAISADQETAPIASVMTKEAAVVGGTFKQLDLQTLSTGIPHATFNANQKSTLLPANAQAYNEITVGGLITIPNPTIIVLSPRRLYTAPGSARFYQFILQKGFANGKPGLGFSRTKTSMWKVQWEGLAVESQPNGARVARLIEQT